MQLRCAPPVESAREMIGASLYKLPAPFQRGQNPPRPLLAMLPMMAHPRFAQNLAAKSPVPFLAVPRILGKRQMLFAIKRMRRGPQPHHWFPCFYVFDNV